MGLQSGRDKDNWRDLVMERGPVGRWRPALGTAGVLSGDEVLFDADGTGRLHSHSVVFGEETIAFRWRMAHRGRLILLVDGEEEAVAMEFRDHISDAGRATVLAEVANPGFWIMPDPLKWAGDT
ncbi:hypothetical protein [Sinosporangium siamense]|uniref:Uncharacterized protein n=1 Tax=Sinosporangium siamense TaxID=1367973 RepID=A0A919V942_9ACTN|nr:hypothetical protein [Sinosporangium siamense]GII93902.1 hypothetical protein Ssi02_41330 [Sinosporangium siamense]